MVRDSLPLFVNIFSIFLFFFISLLRQAAGWTALSGPDRGPRQNERAETSLTAGADSTFLRPPRDP